MFGNKKTAFLQNQINHLSTLTLSIRDALGGVLGQSHNGKRNTYDVYGYPQHYCYKLGYHAIRREGIAQRVVCGVAQSCWRDGFTLHTVKKDGSAGDPILADELNLLEQSGLFKALERADIMQRIGNFSCLLVGVPDGSDFREPLGRVQGDALKSIYFRAYCYDGITVSDYNTDTQSPRYGMPELYQLQIRSFGDSEKSMASESIVVHWSRILHLVETPLDNDLEGISALEPIYNRILDIDKATGGASEAYFRNARGKIAFEVDPDFALEMMDDEKAKNSFDEAGKKFTNDWQDQISAIGSKAVPVTTPHADPLNTIKVALWGISGNTGIPIRVLTGEGAGQLAGSEDRVTYNALINDRQDHVCSPWVRRVLEIMSDSGVLDVPDVYEIEYPLTEPLTEIDQADLNNKRADTLNKITSSLTSIGGAQINAESALEAFGFDEIELDEIDLDDIMPDVAGVGDGTEDDTPPAEAGEPANVDI